MTPRNCHWCEHEFTPPKHDTAKYCCGQCRIAAMNEATRKRKAEAKKAVGYWQPEVRFCEHCGISYTPIRSLQKYHSRECASLAAKAKAKATPRKDHIPVPVKAKPVKLKPKPRVWVVRCDTVEECRDYYGLDHREPAKPVAKSLAECEAMKGIGYGNR